MKVHIRKLLLPVVLLLLGIPTSGSKAHHKGWIFYIGNEYLVSIKKATTTRYEGFFLGKFLFVSSTGPGMALEGYQVTRIFIDTDLYHEFFIPPKDQSNDNWSWAIGGIWIERHLWNYVDPRVDLLYQGGVPLQGVTVNPNNQNWVIQTLGWYKDREFKNPNSGTNRMAKALDHNYGFEKAAGGWGRRSTVQGLGGSLDVNAVEWHPVNQEH